LLLAISVLALLVSLILEPRDVQIEATERGDQAFVEATRGGGLYLSSGGVCPSRDPVASGVSSCFAFRPALSYFPLRSGAQSLLLADLFDRQRVAWFVFAAPRDDPRG
jgi:hypothetical protein